MIYLWEMPENCTNKLIAEYRRDLSVDRFLFLNGTFVKKEQIDKPIIFDHEMVKEKISRYDCIPNNSDAPLVSQRVVELLMEYAPENVQFFDAEVHCKDGVLTHYKILNITSTFIGIDHAQSVYKKFDNSDAMYGVRKLVYKPGCMGIHQIARDKEYTGNILVSETIKQLFEKEKIKGARFITPEELYALLYPER